MNFNNMKNNQTYSPPFKQLNTTLKNSSHAIPMLLLDMDALEHNIKETQALIAPNMDFRIVVKSLPSRHLVDYLMRKMPTKKLMVFHQPFLSQISTYVDAQTDILVGKPMPIQAVVHYYNNLPSDILFTPQKQLQWLVDTPQRINEYIQFAKTHQVKLRLNIEIDVGLHRGGFNTIEMLKPSLKKIEQNPDYVEFSGFMGYDPHIVKVPNIIRSRKESFRQMKDTYNTFKTLVQQSFPKLWHDQLTFNGAGSPTLALHTQDSPLNEVAAGSCFVQPTDFDIDTLSNFRPACYIATPILKKYKNTNLSGIEKFAGLLNLWNNKMRNSYFIYGGAWMAEFYEPKGIEYNALFGKSTNQSMINASDTTPLEVGDFVFLRPTQSEFVFLQFEHIIPFRGNTILEAWDTF